MFNLFRKKCKLQGDVVYVADGFHHTVNVTGNKVYAFGNNSYGQLGLGDKKNRSKFTEVKFFTKKRIKEVAAGHYHTGFVADDGAVYTCGYGSNGQLGHGDTLDKLKPTKVKFFTESKIKIVQIFMGGLHTIFVADDDAVYTCGRGWHGQLGNWCKFDIWKPRKIKSFSKGKILCVAAGLYHTVVGTEDGVYTFGNNEYGQLGLGDTKNRLKPTKVEFFTKKRIKIKEVAAGQYYTRFVDENNSVYICGEEKSGQLRSGNGRSILISTKVK